MFVGSFVALCGDSPTLFARFAFFAPLRLSPLRLCALGGDHIYADMFCPPLRCGRGWRVGAGRAASSGDDLLQVVLPVLLIGAGEAANSGEIAGFAGFDCGGERFLEGAGQIGDGAAQLGVHSALALELFIQPLVEPQLFL